MAVCRSVLWCVAVHGSLLFYKCGKHPSRTSCAVCCSVLQCVAVCCSVLFTDVRGIQLGDLVQCVAVCSFSVLQWVAVCCNVSQCVVYRCGRNQIRRSGAMTAILTALCVFVPVRLCVCVRESERLCVCVFCVAERMCSGVTTVILAALFVCVCVCECVCV